MVSYINQHTLTNGKYYAEIFALQSDKIDITNLANGSKLTVMDLSDTDYVPKVFYFDEQNMVFKAGDMQHVGYVTVMNPLEFTVDAAGQQRLCDPIDLSRECTYYVELTMNGETNTIPITDIVRTDGADFMTLSGTPAALASVYGDDYPNFPGKGTYLNNASPLAGTDVKLSITCTPGD